MPYTKIFPVAVTALTGTGTAPPPPAVGGPAATFVFRPGGPNNPGIFNTWSGLMLAVAQVPGQKFITYDDSLNVCEVPAGSWNVDNCVISSAPRANGAALLTIDNGALLVYSRLDLVNARLFVHATSAVSTFTGSNTAVLRLDTSVIDTLSTGPFLRVASAGVPPAVTMVNLSQIGDGTHHVFQVDAGAELDIALFTGSSISGNATSGAGTVNVSLDSSVLIGGSQATSFNQFPLGDAHNVPYTPATLANWNNSNPTTLQVALDRIAAHISPIP